MGRYPVTDTRLIETTFPLRQVSLDSAHEKNVRHGHISTLHIWPARRPLAASRATLLAALLRDPGNADARRELLRRMAGRVEEAPGRDGDRRKETRGGILHWGRESEPEGAEEIERLRAEIREAFGGRAPRVLDPFAGGGAIPLEAMRLGCETVRLGPEPGRVVHPALHAALSAAAGREEAPLAGVRLARTGVRRGVPEGAGRHGEGGAARGARTPGTWRRRGGADDGAGAGAGLAGRDRRRRVASPGLGPAGARAGAAGAGGALSDLRGVRAGAAQGAAGGGGARGAVSPPASPAARAGRGRARVHEHPQRRVRLSVPGARRQPALGGKAGGSVSLGAHGPLRRLPRRDPAAQDVLAVPQSKQARAAHLGAPGRRRRRRLRDRT